jgi:hypothetical protein
MHIKYDKHLLESFFETKESIFCEHETFMYKKIMPDHTCIWMLISVYEFVCDISLLDTKGAEFEIFKCSLANIYYIETDFKNKKILNFLDNKKQIKIQLSLSPYINLHFIQSI